MSLATGPVSHLRTRAVYAAINSRCSRCDVLSVSVYAREELGFWFKSVARIALMADLFGLILVQQELGIQMPAIAVMEVMRWSLVQRLPMDCGLKQKL